MKTLVDNLLTNNEVRSSISTLRSMIKEDAPLRKLKSLLNGQEDLLRGFLISDDAKTRKNAALLIGDLGWDELVSNLYDAYDKETMLFVKSSYLTAMNRLECKAVVPDLEDRMNSLLSSEIPQESKKHVEDELREIRKILIRYKGITTHTFCGDDKKAQVLLICNRNHREIVRRNVVDGAATVHPLGVMVDTDRISSLYDIRTYRDMAFPIHTDGFISSDPTEAGQQLWASDLYEILTSLHKEAGPFYYRIEVKAPYDLEERTRFSKKLAATLEQQSGGKLVNSTGDYEIELRLIANREGKFFPCIKLMTMKDKRFLYRKNSISASIHPSTAALIMELAAPYLKENAQIMDPFCGVGTMLIERNYRVHAREMYGTDIFGDAIEKARENTDITGMHVNYIHRDFFDFKHEYKFDEIMTNMPVKGKKTKDEMDSLYKSFFDKAAEILTESGIVVMYTNEMGLVKKQLRIRSDYKLLQETCMQTKSNFYLLVLGFEG